MNNQGVHENPIREGLEDGVELQPLGVVNVPAQVHGGNLIGNAKRLQNSSALRYREHYKADYDATTLDGPIVLPPLPPGHTFVVTNSLIQMFTVRGLFAGLASEDPYAHMAKLSSVCKSCVGRLELDMDIIGLRAFPLSRLEMLLSAEKVNAVNYLTTSPPPLVEEYYYEEDVNLVNDQAGVFRTNAQGSNLDNWCQGQGNQGRNYGSFNSEGNYVRDGNHNHDNNYNQNNYGNKNDKVGPYVPSSNREGGNSMSHIEDMMQKMMKRSDATNENVKEMQNDLFGIGQKVDAHAVSIKQLKQQFSQLSTTVNPRQLGTLPSNTIQNPKNDGHCMSVTTHGGNQAIDPSMSSEVERVIEKDEDEIKVTEIPKNDTENKVEVTQKVVPMPRPPPPFPQRLVKKTEEGKYRRFITMLK
ncbi:hypothetical protein R3W88_026929 [Solanum pinnatisectum]|uniref:Integrase core domain containing protein n=1 Tax=Solanum pinnatisectum TaxID=50273 RepID=A0AAV9LEK4_9SOLN|nr:hypothetical protein R3W88_026929 [Solanum pinnatisectum]